MKIMFIVPSPVDSSPSQRFRYEQYFERLSEGGHEMMVFSFFTKGSWFRLYNSGSISRRLLDVVVGFFKRVYSLFLVYSYDLIFIHREAAPVGPPIFEWIIGILFRKRIIYDFDDAIWLTDRVDEPGLMRFIKWRSKVRSICGWSYKISCGNQYLATFAKEYNKQVVVNPTTIDTYGWHNPDHIPKSAKRNEDLVIGWTGSHSTLKYLRALTPVLERLEIMFPRIKIMVIADQDPLLKLDSVIFVPWDKATEVKDLMKIDIGLMPLPDDEWTKGKCGFKALQYMALMKPVVASAVGVNNEIISNGMNGFLCSTNAEWEAALTRLVKDDELRARMGEDGRKTVIDRYSVASNAENFLRLFE
jgi:glycosyltransferase involved in cell wall biosynthesis